MSNLQKIITAFLLLLSTTPMKYGLSLIPLNVNVNDYQINQFQANLYIFFGPANNDPITKENSKILIVKDFKINFRSNLSIAICKGFNQPSSYHSDCLKEEKRIMIFEATNQIFSKVFLSENLLICNFGLFAYQNVERFKQKAEKFFNKQDTEEVFDPTNPFYNILTNSLKFFDQQIDHFDDYFLDNMCEFELDGQIQPEDVEKLYVLFGGQNIDFLTLYIKDEAKIEKSEKKKVEILEISTKFFDDNDRIADAFYLSDKSKVTNLEQQKIVLNFQIFNDKGFIIKRDPGNSYMKIETSFVEKKINVNKQKDFQLLKINSDKFDFNEIQKYTFNFFICYKNSIEFEKPEQEFGAEIFFQRYCRNDKEAQSKLESLYLAQRNLKWIFNQGSGEKEELGYIQSKIEFIFQNKAFKIDNKEYYTQGLEENCGILRDFTSTILIILCYVAYNSNSVEQKLSKMFSREKIHSWGELNIDQLCKRFPQIKVDDNNKAKVFDFCYCEGYIYSDGEKRYCGNYCIVNTCKCYQKFELVNHFKGIDENLVKNMIERRDFFQEFQNDLLKSKEMTVMEVNQFMSLFKEKRNQNLQEKSVYGEEKMKTLESL